MFAHLQETQSGWSTSPQRIVLYAHGGLNSEKTGLDIAQRQLNWWLRNEVYPITFAWETGTTESFGDQLADLFGRRTPAGGFGFDVFEQVDRMIEKTAKRTLTWVWDEMKQNAAGASAGLPDDWRNKPDGDLPGGSLLVTRLRQHLDEHSDTPTEIHLVSHSAGSIFLAGLIKQLKAADINVASLTYLAAAIRTDEWIRNVLPRLKQGDIKRFTAFGMDAERELDDVCAAGGVAIYHKSLLYLVSRAFERPTDPTATEVPLIGMAHFADDVVGRTSYLKAVESLKDARLVWSPASSPADGRSDSKTHGGFDDDNPTMTSVLLRILGTTTVKTENEYVPNLRLGSSTGASTDIAPDIADQPPDVITVEVHDGAQPGPEVPTQAAGASKGRTKSAARRGAGGAAREGSRVIEALEQRGWKSESVSSASSSEGRRA